jgi:hypothetical protein
MKNVVSFKCKPRTHQCRGGARRFASVHMDGRTQKAIGLATGVSQTTIGNIASGKTMATAHHHLPAARRCARIRIEDAGE